MAAERARRALITGITGQDGSYLAEFLLERGYDVHGLVRRSSTLSRPRIDHLAVEGASGRIHLHYGDLADLVSLTRLVEQVQPDEVYNLAGQSHVGISFDMPEYTFEVTGLGAFRMLEAVRRASPAARFYQAGSSEMFGRASEFPQRETTHFNPVSPYGIAKVLAHHCATQYRRSHGMFVTNGILFNHESPRRGENFVTRKIARAAARIAAGVEKDVALGNLDPRRDWGYAPEYVEAMWLMVQHDEPDDFVIATGVDHSVREFAELAFAAVGLDWQRYVRHESRYDRASEVQALRGDSLKARKLLGWQATTTFQELVGLMVEYEIEELRKEQPDR